MSRRIINIHCWCTPESWQDCWERIGHKPWSTKGQCWTCMGVCSSWKMSMPWKILKVMTTSRSMLRMERERWPSSCKRMLRMERWHSCNRRTLRRGMKDLRYPTTPDHKLPISKKLQLAILKKCRLKNSRWTLRTSQPQKKLLQSQQLQHLCHYLCLIKNLSRKATSLVVIMTKFCKLK